MQIPPTTKKQKEILNYLYQFRFIHTHQLQKLLNHKNPNRTLSWIKDLINKKYVKRDYDRKSFIDNTNPAIYFLGPKSKKFLQKEKDLDSKELEYIYQEHRREKKFINHCLFIVDVYLYLLSQKEADEKLTFFTKNELRDYVYFPEPRPDAFISIEGIDTTQRYFLDYFDEYTPPFVLRNRVKMYFTYADQTDWIENTDGTPFPTILFICPNESLRRHIKHYATALLEKEYDNKIELFLTTKKKIEQSDVNLWEKAEI